MKKDSQSNVSVKFVDVTEANDGQRIDNYLKGQLKGVPKSLIYRVLRKGEVRVNKKRVKPEYRLQAGDQVRIPPVRVAQNSGESPHRAVVDLIESRILLETSELIVLNKPSGVAVHGGSGVSYGVIEALRASRGDSDFLELVHRLDRETSGCLMVAKKRSMLKHLHQTLQLGEMEKIYHALVVGSWKGREHLVEAPLARYTQGGERIVRVSREGKAAVTEFRLLEHFGLATLVEARPITGRTHQIRVHAQYAGHPLAGDEKYAARAQRQAFKEFGLKRLFLHACRLRIPDALPGGKDLDVKAPMDAELLQVLDRLREAR